MKYFITVLFIVFTCTRVHAQIEKVSGIKEHIDLVYTVIDDWEGRLDIYVPKDKKNVPLVIYVHGGGWYQGAKEREYDKFKVFLENGYAVANIGYRLAGKAVAPAAVEDVNCAIQYIMNKADEFSLDKEKVVLMGGSAGAHLALLVALQSSAPVFKGNCQIEPFHVSAIISKYGPTDLLTWESLKHPDSKSLTWLGERKEDVEFMKLLSPYHVVTQQSKIPVLFVHGTDDRSVPIIQSQKLYDKLKEYGCEAEMYVVDKGKHGNFGDAETIKMDKKMIAFLKEFVLDSTVVK